MHCRHVVLHVSLSTQHSLNFQATNASLQQQLGNLKIEVERLELENAAMRRGLRYILMSYGLPSLGGDGGIGPIGGAIGEGIADSMPSIPVNF